MCGLEQEWLWFPYLFWHQPKMNVSGCFVCIYHLYLQPNSYSKFLFKISISLYFVPECLDYLFFIWFFKMNFFLNSWWIRWRSVRQNTVFHNSQEYVSIRCWCNRTSYDIIQGKQLSCSSLVNKRVMIINIAFMILNTNMLLKICLMLLRLAF